MPKIRLIDKPRQTIRDTSTPRPSLSPEEVAAALGAEPTGLKIEGPLSPMSLFATRRELFEQVISGSDSLQQAAAVEDSRAAPMDESGTTDPIANRLVASAPPVLPLVVTTSL